MTEPQTWAQWLLDVDIALLGIAGAIGFMTMLVALVSYRFQGTKIVSACSLFGDVGLADKSAWDLIIGIMYLMFVMACWFSNPIIGGIVEAVPLILRRKQRTAIRAA